MAPQPNPGYERAALLWRPVATGRRRVHYSRGGDPLAGLVAGTSDEWNIGAGPGERDCVQDRGLVNEWALYDEKAVNRRLVDARYSQALRVIAG